MNIRAKIVLVVLPVMIVSILLVGLSSYLLASSGINRLARDFLGFKVTELQKYSFSQYQLLVENGLQSNPEFIQATKGSMEVYASSIIRSDTELILAVNADGEIEISTGNINSQSGDAEALAGIYRQASEELIDLEIGGVARVGKGFEFVPFGWYVLVTESRETFFQDINQIALRTLILLAASCVIATLVLAWFAGRLTRPLHNVVNTMKEIISTSDMSKQVEVEYNDETGTLAHTFNIMTRELDKAYDGIKRFALNAAIAEKKEERARKDEQKIRQIFQKYVPQELIDQFFESPDSMLVGEDRVVAILFSDIRSFTSISEKMHPSDLVSQLNIYFDKMVTIIMNRGGIVDKYIGDAIMAIFGAPVKRENDAFEAVMAGLEMVEAIDAFNAEQAAQGFPAFKTGIGINYGLVTVGNIGAEKKMDYTVIGDNVNLASRLEGQTKDYHQDLIISESLNFKVGDKLPTRLLDSIAVKGKKQGTKIYTVQRELSPEDDRIWKIHNRAMEFYYAREFGKAVGEFEKILARSPDDFMAAEMLERSKRYEKTPPPAEWNGVEIKQSK